MKNLEKYVEVNCHDNHTGKLRKVLMNSHKTYTLSTGEDGLIFVCSFNALAFEKFIEYFTEREAEEISDEDKAKILQDSVQEIDKEGITQLALENSIALTGEVNVDIDPKVVLSLQKGKLKAEEDAKQKLAQSKKEKTKNEIDELRKEYNKIVSSHLNNASVEIKKEFDEFTNVDCDYFDTLSKDIQGQIQEVCRELEYDKEKHKVAVEKLRKEYYDPLEYGIVTIKGIKSQAFARTFRLTKLAEFVELGLKVQEDIIKSENEKREKHDDNDDSMDNSVKGGTGNATDSHGITKAKGNTFQLEPPKEKKQKKSTVEINQEKRRQDRLKKREEKEEIKKMEPKDEDDPAYKEKMDGITANKGDKKLKNDPDYNVPEEQRRDANKQRYEMLLLIRGLYNIQKNHNDKVLEMRDRKAAIVKKLFTINKRLADINKVLGLDEELFQPSVDETLEYPEKYYEVHEADLISHLQKQKSDENAKKERRDSEDMEQKQEDYYDKYLIEPPKEAAEQQFEEESKLPPERKDYTREKSVEEVEQDKIREIELTYEKQTLKDELTKEIENFDTEIETLQHAKMKSESDKKYGEMKLIIGYNALFMLKGLVDRDTELTERLGKFKEEKLEIAKRFNEIAKQMNDKEVIMNNIKEEKDQIIARFDELIPLNHPARQELYSFFERKIKQKKADKEEKVDDEGSKNKDEEAIAEESDEEEDKDAWDEDEDAKTQPGGANKEQYHIDQIIEERAKKLELEKNLKQMAKDNAKLQEKSINLEKTKNRIDEEQKKVEEEIKVFQQEKMRRLNKIEQSFVLRLSQIQNLEKDKREDRESYYEMLRAQRNERLQKMQELNEKPNQGASGELEAEEVQNQAEINKLDEYIGFVLPSELKDSLLFTENDIKDLLKIIVDHRLKSKTEENLQKSKNAEKAKKMKQIVEKEKEMRRKQQILEDELQLKFGSVIKLDDEIPWTANTDNIKKKEAEFSKVEKGLNKNIHVAEVELESKKRELNDQVKRNTELLNHIKTMGEKSADLQKKLTNANEQIFKMDNAEQRNKLIEEKAELEEKLSVQNYKIETIRKEIELFRKKGGHIYTAVTANKRTSGGNP